jgi:CelD/BcsL family acetyltransferase involved in cellulose biosynthesis
VTLVRLSSDDPSWVALARERREATVFHDPAWSRLIADTYGFEPFVLALPAHGGGLACGIPCVEIGNLPGRRRWVALPFTDHVPPLATSADALHGLAALLEERRRAAGIRSIEVRAGLHGEGAHAVHESVRHTLELGSDPEALFRTFHRSQVQRNVLRAERDGVVVRRSRERSDLEVFYRLHALTRRRQGTPVQPRRFFANLHRHLIEPGHGWVSVASKDGCDLAACVFLAQNATVVYKFGASDERHWGLRPNHAVFWDAIRWSIEQGFERLDFGRTELDQEGLRSFKSGWGSVEEPLRYVVLAEAGPAPRRGRAGRLAPPVIRRSPVWVARMLGEIAYRWAA